MLLATVLSACGTVSPPPDISISRPLDTGSPSQTLSWQRSNDQLEQARERTRQLLNGPLTAQRAADIALFNNPGLQVRMADLGIGQAEFEQASRLPNPGFSFGKFSNGDEREVERSLHINLIRLLLFPSLKNIEQQRLEQTRLLTAGDALTLVNRTRRAFFEAVAASQQADYARKVMQTAQASNELARRMEQAGNFNALSRAREQAFYADAQQLLNRAQAQEKAARQRLIRLLGLPADSPLLQLPTQLPPLPAELESEERLRTIGLSQRLDLQAAQTSLQRSADFLGLTRASRFITFAELGGLRETSNEGSRKTGYEIGIELPIFDSGQARLARAEALYMQALSRVRENVINADSEIMQAADSYRSAHELARHQRDEVLPLRKRIADESLLRYNGMLIGVFELLAETRVQIASVAQSIDLLRDFWLAETDLQQALTGRPLLPTGLIGPASGAANASSAASPHGGGGGH
jgi:outer membrane protein TolC